jgi:Putative lipoprotein
MTLSFWKKSTLTPFILDSISSDQIVPPQALPMQVCTILIQRAFGPCILCAVLFAGGCATAPPIKPLPTDAAQLLQRAAALSAAQNLSAAAATYRQLADESPPPARQDYQLRAAELLRLEGELSASKALLAATDVEGLPPILALRKHLTESRIALAEQQPEQALALLDAERDAERLAPSPLRAELLDTRAEAEVAAGRGVDAARERVARENLLTVPQAIAENRRKIWSALFGMPVRELQAPTESEVLRGWMELAYIAHNTRFHPEQFEPQVAAWKARYPAHPASEALIEELLAQFSVKPRRPSRVALVLPLSGRLNGPASAIRDGFLAAYYADSSGALESTIQIYDTGDDASQATHFYRKAVQDGAEFIVGPLDKEAVAALAHAESLDVPVLALNYLAPSETPPAALYQFGLLPEDEARQVAERAILDGRTQALVMIPQGDWGRRLANAFSARFSELGGKVLEQQTYNPKDSDFSGRIRDLLKLDDGTPRYQQPPESLGRDPRFEQHGRNEADMIFMAALPRAARLIHPQLKFHRVGEIPVYSTSHVYSGNPAPEADSDIEGVIFCDIPWTLDKASASQSTKEVVWRLWPEAAGSYIRFYALGLDAYALIPYLSILKNEPYERFMGETGALYIGEGNRLHRGLSWAQFTEGRPRLVDAPLTSLTPP